MSDKKPMRLEVVSCTRCTFVGGGYGNVDVYCTRRTSRRLTNDVDNTRPTWCPLNERGVLVVAGKGGG